MARERYCVVDGCVRLAEGADLCATHRKRVQRGVQLGLPIAEKFVSPWERVTAAAIDLADVDAEDDLAHARAEDRLKRAALEWCRDYLSQASSRMAA